LRHGISQTQPSGRLEGSRIAAIGVGCLEPEGGEQLPQIHFDPADHQERTRGDGSNDGAGAGPVLVTLGRLPAICIGLARLAASTPHSSSVASPNLRSPMPEASNDSAAGSNGSPIGSL